MFYSHAVEATERLDNSGKCDSYLRQYSNGHLAVKVLMHGIGSTVFMEMICSKSFQLRKSSLQL